MLSEAKIHLDFQGYWAARHLESLPNQAGVYCVYAGEHLARQGAQVPRRLLYVGDGLAVRDRITAALGDPESRTRWERHLRPGEEFLFTFAPIILGRTRSRAALAFRNRPPENLEFKFRFPFEPTTLLLSGKIFGLPVSFSAPDLALETDHEGAA